METEYAIFVVMVITAIGFAWLWFNEQRKKRKSLCGKKRSGDSVQDHLASCRDDLG